MICQEPITSDYQIRVFLNKNNILSYIDSSENFKKGVIQLDSCMHPVIFISIELDSI